MASGMGSSNKLAEIWNAFGDERINAVAVLSNSYFFTEKIPLEGAKISDSEMENMVQMTISTMIPEGNFEIVYGYSISSNGSEINVFAASKERILEEIPEVANIQYWVPDEYASTNFGNVKSIVGDKNYSVFTIDSSGRISTNIGKVKLFTKSFWTAELHKGTEKAANKARVFLDQKLSVTCSFSLLTIALAAGIFFGRIYIGHQMEKFANIDKKKLEVEAKENAFKLTDIFSGRKSAALSYLSEINDIRPIKSMFFKSYEITNSSKITIEGYCSNENILNSVVDKLKRDESTKVTSSNQPSNDEDGALEFKLEVEFA